MVFSVFAFVGVFRLAGLGYKRRSQKIITRLLKSQLDHPFR